MKDETTGSGGASSLPRVLHLLDRQPDYQTQTAVAQLSRHKDAQLRTIGRGGDFSTLLAGVMQIRRHAACCDLIHAWGQAALTIAALRGGKRIIYSPTTFPTPHDVRWLHAVMSARDVQVICPTDTTRRMFVERGIPIDRCHLIRPGVDFATVNRKRDDALRSRLGYTADDFVMLAAGESVRAANHRAAILAAAVLHVFDPKYKLLLWGHGSMRELEQQCVSQMLPGNHISMATNVLGHSTQLEQLLPAADAVLVTADAPVATLPIAVCMAAGLPIVAVVSETISELLEDRHNALLVGGGTSRLIARRVLDLREDQQLRWRICDTARTEAYEFFSMTRFVEEIRTVYQQASAGQTVRLPLRPAGAGTRFAGRA